MPQPRNRLVSLDDIPYYPCIARCVRRAWLCGTDEYTGQCFEHRRGWIVDRLRQLQAAYSIEIAAYAVMSNHYHLVVRLDRDTALSWDAREVIQRWGLLHHLPPLVQGYLDGTLSTPAQREVVDQWVASRRERLYSLSWFMAELNESIARQANAEDGCTGRFWEGRFKSQALLGEAAVLACMAYVDLNPIRAAIAETPEDSDYTSAQQRVQSLGEPEAAPPPDKPALMPLVRAIRDDNPHPLNYEVAEYLELLDWTGRVMREDKRGYIRPATPPILARLGLDEDGYVMLVKNKPEKGHVRAIGTVDRLKDCVKSAKQRFIKGIGLSRALYARPT